MVKKEKNEKMNHNTREIIEKVHTLLLATYVKKLVDLTCMLRTWVTNKLTLFLFVFYFSSNGKKFPTNN